VPAEASEPSPTGDATPPAAAEAWAVEAEAMPAEPPPADVQEEPSEEPAATGAGAAPAPAARIGVQPGARLDLRLELDPDAGELVISIEDGAVVRLVRGPDGWYLESD
jgi:hypothetical protein